MRLVLGAKTQVKLETAPENLPGIMCRVQPVDSRAFGVFFQISKHSRKKIDIKVLNIWLRVVRTEILTF
jgi:hypothetical protein